MIPQNKILTAAKLLDLAAFSLMMVFTVLWAVWGTAEAFHEGWHHPYWHIIFYFIPFILIFGFSVLAIYFPLAGGIFIFLFGIAYTILISVRASRAHFRLEASLLILNAAIVLAGMLFILQYIIIKKTGISEYRWLFLKKYLFFKKKVKIIAIACISIIIIVSMGVPGFIRNINRVPLENLNEISLEGNQLSVILAPGGPGWYYSNKSPIIFNDKEYSGLSWNEIALFGKEPVGFEDKNYGRDYSGSAESIYYATQQDFDKYNMFRYIDHDGLQLTKTAQDFWKLPAIDDYVRLLNYRGNNAKGYFDFKRERALYGLNPDKDAPLWAPAEMVIYYWSSTSANNSEAYDITYSGRVRKISKITKQDYRGFRAVKTSVSSSSLVKMEVDGILIDRFSETPIILLRESEGERYLMIWIGMPEAYSIAMALNEVATARPMTHDLILTILKQLGTGIESIEITKMLSDTYFANINIIRQDGSLLKIDARPSDAIALAIRLKCEIFVFQEVIDSMGIEFENTEEKEMHFKQI